MKVTLSVTVEPVAVFQHEGESDTAYRQRVRDTVRIYVRAALSQDNRLRGATVKHVRIVKDQAPA